MKIATLAIVLRNSSVLLGYKKTGEIGAHTLNGPGGKCKKGESPVQCVVRETKEEIGITLFPQHLEETALITFFAGGIPDFKVHIFRTSVFAGSPVETADMIPGWHDINDLPTHRMLESDKEWLPKVIRGEKFRANVFYKNRAANFERIEFFPF
ncbi:MAG: NUDIX domain-containing protein [bacterium]|nr:NUDIX domain-containing protein [bacterium]